MSCYPNICITIILPFTIDITNVVPLYHDAEAQKRIWENSKVL